MTVPPSLPACGLYRAASALPGGEERVPLGALLSFHNHPAGSRGSGTPAVCLPDHNVYNRWRFHTVGIPVLDAAWPETLEPLPEEGFYSLISELAFDGGRWPKGALLQLGYTRTADPILFLAQRRRNPVENDLYFGEEGVRVPRAELSRLSALVVFVEEDDADPPDGHGHRRGSEG